MWFWLFLVSFVLNCLFVFYVRWLLKTLASINKDIENLNIMVSEFSAHTKSVFELEMFYGDETLSSLMEHARLLSEKLEGLDLILNEEKGDELDVDQDKED